MERNPYSPPATAVDRRSDDTPPSGLLVLARFDNVIEAQVLKDLLVAEDIPSSLGDAHTVQTNGLWTNAMGGVRLLVPAPDMTRARELMAQVQSGALAIDGDADPELAAPVVATDLALWNMDAAAFFSLALTPVFGSVLMLLNARTLGDPRGRRAATAWLTLSLALAALALWKVSAQGPSPWLGLEASAFLLPYTIFWYFLAAHAQSSRIAKAHGRKYVHRSMLRAAATAALALAGVGLASMTF